ncbi:phage antirepressor [Lentzea sp. E54]|uniref:phage antirepressor n=1 Tax=Lentzea xerophila TaxID=3435883 RepID=UPI003DA351D5
MTDTLSLFDDQADDVTGVLGMSGRQPAAGKLALFEYSGRQVRTVQVDGEPWFVAADVCAALDIANVSNALSRLDEDEKGSIRLAEGTSGNPNRSIVNESGLYTLILRSDKPDAKPFKRWVTHEVLPQIRKTGGYGVPALPDMSTPSGQLEVLDRWRAAVALTVEQARELEAAKPKADAFDAYMDAENALGMGAVANQLGLGRNIMMRQLRDAGVLQRDNRPYQQYARHFKVVAGTYEAQNTTHATYTTYVRPSGVELIRKRLSSAEAVTLNGSSRAQLPAPALDQVAAMR